VLLNIFDIFLCPHTTTHAHTNKHTHMHKLTHTYAHICTHMPSYTRSRAYNVYTHA